MEPVAVYNDTEFWDKLIRAIKLEKPKFILTNIDFRLKGFTGQEKFPIQFWNSAVIETHEKLLNSVENNWISKAKGSRTILIEEGKKEDI